MAGDWKVKFKKKAYVSYQIYLEEFIYPIVVNEIPFVPQFQNLNASHVKFADKHSNMKLWCIHILR